MTQHCEVDLGLIDIAEQARKTFIETELLSLGENIKEHGLLMPLLVVPHADHFTLVAGERRLRAMRLVGLKKAQVRVLNPMDAGDTAVVQFIENEFRADLKPAEKAHALLEIKQKKGWNNKQTSEHLHMDASLCTRYLALVRLPSLPSAKPRKPGRLGRPPGIRSASCPNPISPACWPCTYPAFPPRRLRN